jgi:type IV pilus assembly protein PilE
MYAGGESNMIRFRARFGFTLIELMITVAVVAILASIAYPSYQAQLRTSRRADAQASLMELQSFMERFFTENNCYENKGADGSCSSSGDNADPDLPFTVSPRSGTVYYNLALTAATPNSYTLRATPVAGGPQANDGMLELDQTGARRWDKNNDGDFADTGETTWAK